VRGSHDFYAETHRGEDQCHALLRDYLELQRSYFGYGRFEILGHLGYPLRYMARDGFFPDLSRHTDLLAALFGDLIRHDAALEVNTSPLYGPLGQTNPDETVLRLYYDLGGRLVTLGSDAHRPGQIGRGLPETHAMLKNIGFTHQAVYRKRARRLEAL
jgi:histidinol-phosphatase (PHP family)